MFINKIIIIIIQHSSSHKIFILFNIYTNTNNIIKIPATIHTIGHLDPFLSSTSLDLISILLSKSFISFLVLLTPTESAVTVLSRRPMTIWVSVCEDTGRSPVAGSTSLSVSNFLSVITISALRSDVLISTIFRSMTSSIIVSILLINLLSIDASLTCLLLPQEDRDSNRPK